MSAYRKVGISHCDFDESLKRRAEPQEDEESGSDRRGMEAHRGREELQEETAKLNRTNKLDKESKDPEDIRRQIKSVLQESARLEASGKTEETPKGGRFRNAGSKSGYGSTTETLSSWIFRTGVQEVSFDLEVAMNKYTKMLVRIFRLKGFV
jgi:hypothetical protein